MKLNKTVCIILAIILSISFSATNVFAEEPTLCEKVGIGDLSSHKIIKLDGNENSGSPTLMANTQIINLGNSIGVFSSPLSGFKITGDSVRAAILGSNVLKPEFETTLTSEGYTIQYVSPSGSSDGNQTVEAGGIIRAVKGQETIDIPVVDKTVLKTYDGNQIGMDWQNNGGTIVYRDVNTADLAGKANDDKIFWFKVNAGASVNTARAHNHNINTLNTPQTVITVEFAVRVTGDAVATIENNNNGWQMMKYTSDGTFTYRSEAKNAMVDVAACSDGTQWHNVAMVYDYAGARIIYYFDGQMLPELGRNTAGSAYELTGIRFVVPNGTYAKGGTVEFDNLRISRGFYKPYSPTTLSSNSSDVSVEKGSILYDGEKVTSVAQLTSVLTTDADTVTIYKDKTLKETSDTLNDGNVMVLYKQDTDAFSYYELKSLKVTVNSINFARVDGKVSCNATLSYPGSDGTEVTLVMALIDSDGRIAKLASSPATEVTGTKILETPAIDAAGLTPKAFFINNWTLREAISSTIFEEE
ncbi:MAG: hypothetical protein IKV73_06990 [Clostridia bacterium]|nr:hypothetical protein [Clostridia bacterium]